MIFQSGLALDMFFFLLSSGDLFGLEIIPDSVTNAFLSGAVSPARMSTFLYFWSRFFFYETRVF